MKGCGAACNGAVTSGRWSPQEATQHINCLELKAALLPLQSFLKDLPVAPPHILLEMDNSTSVAYINRRGGTQSPSLSLLPLEICSLTEHRLLADSTTSTRCTKCRGRCCFKGTQYSHGVVSQGECLRGNSGSILHARDRPVCVKTQPQSSTIRLSLPRSGGGSSRRFQTGLEPMEKFYTPPLLFYYVVCFRR